MKALCSSAPQMRAASPGVWLLLKVPGSLVFSFRTTVPRNACLLPRSRPCFLRHPRIKPSVSASGTSNSRVSSAETDCVSLSATTGLSSIPRANSKSRCPNRPNISSNRCVFSARRSPTVRIPCLSSLASVTFPTPESGPPAAAAETHPLRQADHENPIRLFPVRRNLRKKFIGGHSRGRRQLHLDQDLRANRLRHPRRRRICVLFSVTSR